MQLWGSMRVAAGAATRVVGEDYRGAAMGWGGTAEAQLRGGEGEGKHPCSYEDEQGRPQGPSCEGPGWGWVGLQGCRYGGGAWWREGSTTGHSCWGKEHGDWEGQG